MGKGRMSKGSERVLPIWEAAFVGCALALGRAASSSPIVFLAMIAATIGTGAQTATRATIVAGPAGLVVGGVIAFVRRGRMVGAPTIALVTAIAVAGGVIATVAPSLRLLAVGLFLVGAGGALTMLYHCAVRRREVRGAAQSGERPRLGSVNAELERWTLPSFTVIAALTAGATYLFSWRAAMAVVTLLVAARAVALTLWRNRRPEAEGRDPGEESWWVVSRRLFRRSDVRRQVAANFAAFGAFAAYWFPLTLLVAYLGWQVWAALWAAGLGLVRFLAMPLIRVFGSWADTDAPAAARAAFRLSLIAPAVLAVAAILTSAPPIAIAIVALGLLIAETTLPGGLVAVRAQVDLSVDQAEVSIAVMVAGTVGVTVAGLAVAPLSWLGPCVAGAALSGIALLAGPGASTTRRRRLA